jgi:hypothetical protein
MRFSSLLLPAALALVACGSTAETSSGTSPTTSSTGGAGGAGDALLAPQGAEALVRISHPAPWCAVRASGKVACFVSPFATHPPTDDVGVAHIAGIDDAVDMTVNGYFACVLGKGGAISCWGTNHDGALGALAAEVLVPTVVEGLTGIAISSDDVTLCALQADGRVTCQGNGQPSADVAGLDDAVRITGGTYGCAIRASGKVACWGAGAPATPVSFIDDAKDLAVSMQLGCVVRASGKVYCWKPGLEDVPVPVPGVEHARLVSVSGPKASDADDHGDAYLFSIGYAAPEPTEVHTVWDLGLTYPSPCVIHTDGQYECQGTTGN